MDEAQGDDSQERLLSGFLCSSSNTFHKDPRVRTRIKAVVCSGIAKLKQPKKWATEAAEMLLEVCKRDSDSMEEGEEDSKEGVNEKRTAANLCKRWLPKFLAKGHVFDEPRSGRKHKVTVNTARTCRDAIIEAQISRKEDAKALPIVAAALHECGASVRTLFNKIKSIDPKFGKCVTVEHKRPLKDEHVQLRIKRACEWLRKGVKEGHREVDVPGQGSPVPLPPAKPLPPNTKPPTYLNTDWLDRIIWIDAKKFYVQPENYKVYGLKGQGKSPKEDSRVKSNPWCIHYYAAVNYKFGAVYIQCVTGTRGKGHKAEGQPYKVCHACSPSLVFKPTVFTAHGIANCMRILIA